MRILYVTPRFPYPPLRGDQVRSYHQLRLLGRRHDVTLLAVADKGTTAQAVGHMESICARVIVLPLTVAKAITGLARLLVGDRRPLQVLLYRRAAGTAAGRLIRRGQFDLIHAQMVRAAGLVAEDSVSPVVIDLVDALSLGYRRRLAVEKRWWRRVALAFEARRVAEYEQALLRSRAPCIVVSQCDRAALDPNGGRVAVNPNGVDCEAYPFYPGRGVSGRIIFAGNLGYAPNRDAVCWFADNVLPALRASLPAAELWIAGARPARGVRRLGGRDGVALLGPVASVHAALCDARVAVVPLRAGAGMQNKVLEAMASGVPVVATSLAVSGMDVRAGEHCLVADTARDFTRAVELLLRRDELGARLARAARTLVASRYSWTASVDQLEHLYVEAVAAGRRPGDVITPQSGELSRAGS